MHCIFKSTAACLLGMSVSCGAPPPELSERVVASAPNEAPQQHPPQHPWCSGTAASATLLVTDDSLGPARVGMPRRELIRDCPTIRGTTWFDAEGVELAASVLRFSGVDVGIAMWSAQGTLETMRIHSPVVVTDRGIRVGSTVGDLRDAFPRLTMGYDDAGVYAWSSEEDRLSYLLGLRVSELLSVPDDVAKRPEVVPDSTRVGAILLAEN